MLTTITHIRELEKNNEDLSKEIIFLARKAKMYKRQNFYLLPLVISLLLLLATPII